jgi:hypothetical protein
MTKYSAIEKISSSVINFDLYLVGLRGNCKAVEPNRFRSLWRLCWRSDGKIKALARQAKGAAHR